MVDQGTTSQSATPARQVMLGVRKVAKADIAAALRAGLEDFAAAPLIGMFLAAAIAVCGLGIAAGLSWLGKPWLIYPFLIGFPLVGPFVAAGFYEVSRRRESGSPLDWGGVIGVIFAQRKREMAWMGFVMLFVFWIWMYQVRLLLALFLAGQSFATLPEFATVVLTTPQGWMFLAVGHVVGAVLALALFSLTVVSMPLLLDRDIDFITAMITSVRAVAASPLIMLGWGVIVTLAVIAACVPFFAGLLIVLPVLGHATWHLYRGAVDKS
jgi:uncharacterized membrane protein